MEKFREYIPSHWKEFKISYDTHLLEVGKNIFNMMDASGKLRHSHSYNNEWFRRGICTSGNVHGETDSYTLEQADYISKEFIDYLQVKDVIRQFKVEDQKHVDGTIDGNKYFVRVENISPSVSLDFQPLQDSYHGSAWWHTDSGTPRQNMVFILYLTDVTKESCPFHISSPCVSMRPNSETESAQAPENFTSENIPEEIVTGPAGTIVCFSSHVLHRASFCNPGTGRKTIQLNLHLDEDRYTCDPYMKSHFEEIS